MFRIDKDVMRVLFDMGDRDLALAFADLEGYHIVRWFGGRCEPAPVFFDELACRDGTPAEQISPGVYSYRIAPKSRHPS